ncbi:hypothetical protein C8J57DRAFT_1721150 [Mycena rebaudengoi]|nr:hypothetical protein C8J57DRAFT_1721150 [Mycena rebaudengoi]
MQVPQETVDAIIDNLVSAGRDQKSPYFCEIPEADIDTLRACSLTARAFLSRSRMNLFSVISCEPESVFKFDALLAESPQIGELYVRRFYLHGTRCYPPIDADEGLVVPRILRRLPNLTHIGYHSHHGERWEEVPSSNKAAFQTTFSLNCLRSIYLGALVFADVSELDLLLNHAKGLKELTLDTIDFKDPVVHHINGKNEPFVVLEALTLVHIEEAPGNAMMSGFTIDIKHLQCLNLITTAMISLLKENEKTLQEVRNSLSLSDGDGEQDLDILNGNQTLRFIEINELHYGMDSTLRQLGHLGHFSALKTISLDFAEIINIDEEITDEVHWPELDTILAQAGEGVADIQIHALTSEGDPPDLKQIRELLPSVADKISVHGNPRLTGV